MYKTVIGDLEGTEQYDCCLQKLGVWTGRDGWKHDLEFDAAYIRDIFICGIRSIS